MAPLDIHVVWLCLLLSNGAQHLHCKKYLSKQVLFFTLLLLSIS